MQHGPPNSWKKNIRYVELRTYIYIITDNFLKIVLLRSVWVSVVCCFNIIRNPSCRTSSRGNLGLHAIELQFLTCKTLAIYTAKIKFCTVFSFAATETFIQLISIILILWIFTMFNTFFVYTHENNACDGDDQLLSTIVI